MMKGILPALFFLHSVVSFAQFSLTGTGSGNTYTQNFNTFAGTAVTIPANWAWTNSDFSPGGYYNLSSAYSNTNSSYAMRLNSGSSDVAFGGKMDGNSYTLTFSLTNNSSSSLDGFVVTWNVEQYSCAATATPVNFTYRLNGGTYGTTGVTGTTNTTASTCGTAANLGSVTSTARSITITGITLAVGGTADFRFTIGNGSSNNAHIGVDDFTLYATAPAACTPPSTQASGLSFNNVLTNQLDLAFTRGNGTGGVLVLARAGAAVNANPQPGTTYTANSVFGSGDQLGSGNYVVYNGTAAGTGTATGNLPVTNLAPGQTYHFAVFEYNATGTCYLTSSSLTGSNTMPCSTPSNVTGAGITANSTQLTINWTNSSCLDEVLVIAREGSAVSFTPTGDGTAYTADAAFSAGTDVGSSQYVVFKGTGTNVAVTGLTNGTVYHFTVFTRKGTNWSAGVALSGTPAMTGYFWNGGNIAATPANGGTGTWGTTNAWRQPTAGGTQAAWADGNNALFTGAAGVVTLDGDRTTTATYINVTGYTFQTTSTTARALNGPMILGNNVSLTLAPNINIATPANGTISFGGNVSGTGTASITLQGTESTGATAQRINLSTTGVVLSVPTTIVSAGGSGTTGVAGYVATAPSTELASAAAITNNSALRTILGATSGNTLTVNSIVSGTASLQFSAGSSGGAGTIILNAQQAYTGNTIFNAANSGIIRLGIDNALPTATDVTMAASSSNGGVLDLNGFNQTIASLSSSVGGGSITNNSTTADATLTISGSATTTFARPITDGTRKVALTRSGTGSLTLTGVNTYTGLTTVSGGTLALANSANTTPALLQQYHGERRHPGSQRQPDREYPHPEWRNRDHCQRKNPDHQRCTDPDQRTHPGRKREPGDWRDHYGRRSRQPYRHQRKWNPDDQKRDQRGAHLPGGGFCGQL